MNKSLRVAVLIAGACLAWTPLVHADVVTDWNARRCGAYRGRARPSRLTVLVP